MTDHPTKMGWYRHPDRPGYQRFWNGSAWTDDWRARDPLGESRREVRERPAVETVYRLSRSGTGIATQPEYVSCHMRLATFSGVATAATEVRFRRRWRRLQAIEARQRTANSVQSKGTQRILIEHGQDRWGLLTEETVSEDQLTYSGMVWRLDGGGSAVVEAVYLHRRGEWKDINYQEQREHHASFRGQLRLRGQLPAPVVALALRHTLADLITARTGTWFEYKGGPPGV